MNLWLLVFEISMIIIKIDVWKKNHKVKSESEHCLQRK